MSPSFGANYLLPAVFLNPVLFLHSVNAILSRILPPIPVDTPAQPPAYSALGPSANHPHIDMRTNDNLCWSYTIVMVCAQLVAFGRVNRNRGEIREKNESAAKSRESVIPSKQSAEEECLHPSSNGSASSGFRTSRAIMHDRPIPVEGPKVTNGHVVRPGGGIE